MTAKIKYRAKTPKYISLIKMFRGLRIMPPITPIQKNNVMECLMENDSGDKYHM